MSKSTFLRESETELFFYFVCKGECGAEGELGLLKEEGMKPFGCPEGCGATYVPWNDRGLWRLECVVLPVRMPVQRIVE